MGEAVGEGTGAGGGVGVETVTLLCGGGCWAGSSRLARRSRKGCGMEEYAAQQRMGRAAVPGGAVMPTPVRGGGAGETMTEYAERVRAEKAAGTAQPSTAARMAAAAAEQGDGLADRVEGQVRFSFPYCIACLRYFCAPARLPPSL